VARHLRTSLAEDLVQEAIARWLRRELVHRSAAQTKSWLGRAMDRIAKEWSIRSRDPLNQHPLSLDQPWARGE
jgi:DNA-directed RNA polymerase specialized sigma24 family protein